VAPDKQADEQPKQRIQRYDSHQRHASEYDSAQLHTADHIYNYSFQPGNNAAGQTA
jgi:hypothetical protein